MVPKREEFIRYATEFMYGVSDGNLYLYDQQNGLYDKLSMRGYIRCYKSACKRDKNLIDLLDLAYEYTKINPQDKDSYAKESLLIEKIDKCAVKALDSTKAAVDTIEETIEVKQQLKDNLSPDEQKKIDFECLLLREDTENCYIASMSLKWSMDIIVLGVLPSTEIPSEYFADADPEQPIGHPVFSHVPVGTDISDALRQSSKFYIVLSNYAKDIPYKLLSIFSDCGGGTVCVKLWDLDTQQPVYVKLNKNEVYDEWMRDRGNATLWPGLLSKALEECGYSVYDDDPVKLFKIVFGTDAQFDDEYFSEFIPRTVEDSQDIHAFEQYFNCLKDISIALLATQSIKKDSEAQAFLTLREAVRLVIGNVFDNFSPDIDLLGPSMDFLKQKTDEYRNAKDPSRKHNRRLEICDSIDQLYSIFKNSYLKYAPIDVFESPTGRSLNRD